MPFAKNTMTLEFFFKDLVPRKCLGNVANPSAHERELDGVPNGLSLEYPFHRQFYRCADVDGKVPYVI